MAVNAATSGKLNKMSMLLPPFLVNISYTTYFHEKMSIPAYYIVYKLDYEKNNAKSAII